MSSGEAVHRAEESRVEKFLGYLTRFRRWFARTPWGVFLRAVLSPWVVISVILTYFLLTQVGQTKDGTAKTLIEYFLAVSGAGVGAVVWGRYQDLLQAGRLVTRGRSAVRSLSYLANYVTDVEDRVASFNEYSADDVAASISTPLARAHLDEIAFDLKQMAAQVLNAVEEWTDIVPEAAVLTQVNRLHQLESEVVRLQASLEEAQEKSQEEVGNIRNLLRAKEGELRDEQARAATALSRTFNPHITPLTINPRMLDMLNSPTMRAAEKWLKENPGALRPLRSSISQSENHRAEAQPNNDDNASPGSEPE